MSDIRLNNFGKIKNDQKKGEKIKKVIKSYTFNFEDHEFFLNFHNSYALYKGDSKISYKDAWEEIIKICKENVSFKVNERPDSVKKRELKKSDSVKNSLNNR